VSGEAPQLGSPAGDTVPGVDRLSAELASLRIGREAAIVTPPRRAFSRVAVLALAAGGVVAGVSLTFRSGAFAGDREVQLAEIAQVSPTQPHLDLTSTGYVVPQVAVDVSSKVTGRVARANAREGSRVASGEVVFELDPVDERASVAAAEARVAAARARVAAAKAQLAEVDQQLDRERRLVEKGAVPPATVEDLAAHAASLREQAAGSRAEVGVAVAEAAASATALTNMVIRSPVDGVVLTKPLQPGDIVTAGQPMARIADFSSIVIETDVPEARLHLVRPGGPCEVVLDAFPEVRWRGEVVETSPQLNRAKAAATVKLRLLDRDDSVLPEMAARVSFLDAPLDRGGAGVRRPTREGKGPRMTGSSTRSNASPAARRMAITKTALPRRRRQ
jgi:RND family efflux transporter MFP subunit